jgi:predicted kinase
MLNARSAEGMVRRGHGDLHLANVALVDGAPMLFDAIEFSPTIAAGDVLYDLAFLLMDLVERDLNAAANVVLNRYLAETRRLSDLDALAALPFFMALRAAIRASVTASRAAVAPAVDRDHVRASAGRYFALAGRLIRPAPPVLIGVGGLSGTGKSRLAMALAPELAPNLGPSPGAVVLRSDVERKALAGLREDERLPADAYTPENAARVYALLAEKAGRILAAGHAAIVDAVYARPDERDALRRRAAAHGVVFHGMFLTSDTATRVARVGARRTDASDATEAVARAQETYALGANDWEAVDASGTLESTLANARKVAGV